MANHVYQALLIEAEDIDAIKNAVKGDRAEFDQSRFFAMPDDLKDTVSGSKEIVSDEEYAELTKTESRQELLAKSSFPCGMPISRSMAFDFMACYGAANWYEWAKKNWGTKWGIYNASSWDVVGSLHRITFESAWSPATKIIQRLSELFPSAHFCLASLDEGYCFACIETIKGGTVNKSLEVEPSESNQKFQELAELVRYRIIKDEDFED